MSAIDDRAEPTPSDLRVAVRLIDSDGKLSEPREVPTLELSDAEWRQRLTPEQYRITRRRDTERAVERIQAALRK